MNTVNQNILAPDMPPEGQYFNLALWFTVSCTRFSLEVGAAFAKDSK